MTIAELKDAILQIVEEYFAGATVVWQNTDKVKPVGSLVTLGLGNVGYTRDSIEQEDEDGEAYRVIPSYVMLTVNLFTKGKQVNVGGNASYFEDTAVDDMLDFVKYINSEYIIQKCNEFDISITEEGAVQNASAAIDPKYEYRALQEFKVNFKQESRGAAGISRKNWQPTSSGGGTEELAEQEVPDVDKDSILVINNNF